CQGGTAGRPAQSTGHLVHGRGLVQLLEAAPDRLDQVLVQIVEPGRRHCELLGNVHHQLPVGGGRRAQLGHAPALGSSRSTRSQSSRMGVKTSITVAPSGPVSAAWGTSPGMTYVSPTASVLRSPAMTIVIVPLSTMPSCSFEWWCSGTARFGSRSTTAKVMRSPRTARATAPSQILYG